MRDKYGISPIKNDPYNPTVYRKPEPGPLWIVVGGTDYRVEITESEIYLIPKLMSYHYGIITVSECSKELKNHVKRHFVKYSLKSPIILDALNK
jgi:hypothetical protein